MARHPGLAVISDAVRSQIAALVRWATIPDKPSTFPPAAHTHAISDVNNLTQALAGKATPQDITNAINGVLNGAPAALDTLKEIADRFAAEDTEQEAMLAAIAVRLRFDASQSLTTPQQAQGRANLGIDLAALVTQRAIVTYPGADITWTYPTPYTAGIVPIIEALAEGPASGGTAANLFNVQLVGPPTNTSCKFRVNTVSAATINLLGLVNLNLFSQAPSGVRIHATVRLP